MEKFWLFGKKGEPKEDIDTDYDDIYYGLKKKKTAEEEETNSYEYGNAYGETESGDVNVVISSETASAIAKAEEPWMKKTFTPASYAEGKDIVAAFKDDRVVVICVEELDRENFVRLFDYLMGAVEALDGTLRREDRETVVLLPYDFDDELSIDELEEDTDEELDEAEEAEDEEDTEDDAEEEAEEEDDEAEDSAEDEDSYL